MWFCQQAVCKARNYLKKPASHLEKQNKTKKNTFLLMVASTQNWGWGGGCSHKPCTNLRSGTVQVHIFTEFTVSRKTPYTCLSHPALCVRGWQLCPPFAPTLPWQHKPCPVTWLSSFGLPISASLAAAVAMKQGPWEVPGSILLPLLSCLLDWEYHEEGPASAHGTSRWLCSSGCSHY